MTSSPRHRTTGSPTTFRLMVSTGGHILPRPHDKSLRYVGGETRMLTVDRYSTLSDLTTRLSKTVITRSSTTSSSTSPVQFTLKYQLPMEDLDSLVSVTNDEDLENMIDECERLNTGSGPASGSGSASRIRLFIFPKPNQNSSDSVSEIGLSLFLENKDNPSKSEDWFLNALNGTSSGYSDTSSVKCLLDLDDQILLPEKKDGRGDNSGHDVRSIPDSPMLETTSSFGSASSQANLPPVEDCLKILASPAAPVVVSGSPVSSWTVIKEQSDPFLSYHEKTDQGLQVDYLKNNQQQSTGLELGSIDSILSDLTITDQSSPVSQIQSSNYNNQVVDPDHDQNNGIQMLQQQQQQNPHNSSYLMPMPTTQPQFIPQPQYIHPHPHHHPSMAVPVTSYYHHPPPDQQTFMYYIPTTHPPQGYNFPLQQQQQQQQQHQPAQADMRSVAPTKTDLPPGVYRTNSGGPQLVRIPSGYQNQPQHVGYSGIHQPTQSMYYATTLSTGQQVRTGQP